MKFDSADQKSQGSTISASIPIGEASKRDLAPNSGQPQANLKFAPFFLWAWRGSVDGRAPLASTTTHPSLGAVCGLVYSDILSRMVKLRQRTEREDIFTRTKSSVTRKVNSLAAASGGILESYSTPYRDGRDFKRSSDRKSDDLLKSRPSLYGVE